MLDHQVQLELRVVAGGVYLGCIGVVTIEVPVAVYTVGVRFESTSILG